MKEYIEREALLNSFEELMNIACEQGSPRIGKAMRTGTCAGIAFCRNEVRHAPAADVVSKELYEQIKWERDVALAQFEEYGVSLGEKADVVEVVRCKDCKYCIPATADGAEYELCIVDNDVFPVSVQKQHFCSRGKRKEE